jgi:hypothetical protein
MRPAAQFRAHHLDGQPAEPGLDVVERVAICLRYFVNTRLAYESMTYPTTLMSFGQQRDAGTLA